MKILMGFSSENFSGDILGQNRVLTSLQTNGYEVDAEYFFVPSEIQEKIKDNIYDIAVFALNIRYIELLSDITKYLKKLSNNTKILLIYPYAISIEDAFDSVFGADYVLPGNSECYIVNFIKLLCEDEEKAACFPYVWSKDQSKNAGKVICHRPFSELPIPTRSIEDFAKFKYAYIQSSDGCKGRCRYCLNTRDKKGWSGKPVSQVVQEIESIYKQFRQYHFIFADKSFEDGGNDRIDEMCDYLQGLPVKLSYRCYLRADSFTENDLPLLTKMRNSGFTNVMVGIESFCDSELKMFGKRATGKQNVAMLKLIEKSGMHAQVGTILFHPLTTLESLNHNFNCMVSSRIYTLSHYISRLYVYKGTLIFGDLAKYLTEYDFRQPTKYNFKDKLVGSIYQFVSEKMVNTIVHQDGEKIRENAYFFYAVKQVLVHEKNFDAYDSEMNFLIDSCIETIKWYFSYLYEKYDLDAANKYLIQFIEEMNIIRRKMDILVKKVIMLFMKRFRGVYRLY